MKCRSIHAKVVLFQTVLAAAVLGAFATTVYQRAAHALHETLDRAILCQADYARYVVGEGEGRSPAELGTQIFAHPDLPSEDRIVRILSPDGEELYASRPARTHGVSLPKDTHARVNEGEDVLEVVPAKLASLRVATVPALVNGHVAAIIQVAAPTDGLREALTHLRLVLLLLSAVALLAAALGGWFLSRMALRPVARMTETARTIGIESLTERVAVPATGDEVERLGETFNDMLARIERAVSQIYRFTADASHELRTPLTAMRGEIDVALRRARTREELEEALRSALEDARHMSRIVEDMLVLARADSGEAPLDLETIPLRPLARHVVEHYAAVAAAASCHLFLAPGQEVSAPADAYHLQQLLENLVDNAVQHTPPGGRVAVCLEQHGEWATLSVADTGSGVPEENLERVFDRFFTTRSGARQGTGLGLSICQWIAHAHGGDIRVQSHPGEGSTFTVRLPLSEDGSRRTPP